MGTYDWAEIGGVRLDGAPTEYPYRGLMLSRISGWRGLPGARGSLDPVPGAHGAYSGPEVLRDPRSMEIRGAAIAETAGVASQLLADLESALAEKVVELRVSDSDGVWSRMVDVEAFTPSETWNRPRVNFTIDLIAPDPVRYRDPATLGPAGLPVREGGLVLPAEFPWDFGTSVVPSLEVVNDGAVPVLPVVTVRGAADAVVVHGGPRRVSFGQFDGELVIDSRERRAWLNGSDVTRHLTRRDWHTVAGGERAGFFFEAVDPSPNTTMTVEYRIGAW